MKNLFSVSGKVALVTGGSRGIGLMIARGLVENGVKTYISSRSDNACNAIAEELSSFGECIPLPADLSDLNAKSLFFLTQALLKPLEAAATEEDPARIINIGSVDGLAIPKLETYSYPASKAAVHHLTRVLAHHLGKRNICVNAIAPGPFESKMMKYTLKNHKKNIEENLPRGRIGTPEDMVGAVIYLSSRAGAYVTGAVIPVDGGTLVADELWKEIAEPY